MSLSKIFIRPVNFRATDDATSPSSVASVSVQGGLLIKKSTYIKENLITEGKINVKNIEQSTSLETGSIVTLGGAAFGKNVTIGGNLNMKLQQIINVGPPIDPTDAATKVFVESLVNNPVQTQITSVGTLSSLTVAGADATSAIAAGGLFTGGVGIAKTLWIGGAQGMKMSGIIGPMVTKDVNRFTTGTFTGTGRSGLFFESGDWVTLGTANLGSSVFNGVQVVGYNADSTYTPWVTVWGYNGTVTITATTDATSIVTGAVQIKGGTSISKSLYIGGETVISGAKLSLTNATSNTVIFSNTGVAIPATTTRSLGTKLVMYSNISATEVDYAIGIEPYCMWRSVPGNTATYQHKWYGGTTNIMSLTGTGILNVASEINLNNATGSRFKLNSTGNSIWMCAVPGDAAGDYHLYDTSIGRIMGWYRTTNSITFGSTNATAIVTIPGTTDAVSSTTGALQVSGGMVVNKTLLATGTGKTTSTYFSGSVSVVKANGNAPVEAGTQKWVVPHIVAGSATLTSTGIVYPTLTAPGVYNIAISWNPVVTSGGGCTVTFGVRVYSASGVVVVPVAQTTGGLGVGGYSTRGTNGNLTISAPITSTTPTIVVPYMTVNGGISDAYVNFSVTATIPTSASVYITDTTDSTSSWTGALQLYGGAAINKSLTLGGTFNALGDSIFTGSSLYVQDTLNAVYQAKYPPAAMTAITSTLSIQRYGNGAYTVSSATVQHPFSPLYSVFDNTKGTVDGGWHPNAGVTYTAATGMYTGTVTTTVSSSDVLGDWIQLQSPEGYALKKTILYARPTLGTQRMPRSFVIAGSNDGTTWTTVYSTTGVVDYTPNGGKEFVINSATLYTYYRLIVREIGNLLTGGTSQDYVNLRNWELYAPVSLVTVLPTTESTSITTGAFNVPGGASVGKSLWVGNGITSLAPLVGTPLALYANSSPAFALTFSSTNPSGGLVPWNMSMTNNGTSYPAFMTFDRGNVSIANTLSTNVFQVNNTASGWVNVATMFAPNASVSNGAIVQFGIANTANNYAQFVFNNVGSGLSTNYVRLQIGGGSGLTLNGNGIVSIESTTVSSSVTTGALVVAGGAGISGSVFIGTNLSVTGTSTITGLTSSGNVSVTASTVSSSATTGALVVAGGAGISGSVFIGTNLSVSGTSTFTGIVTVPTPVNATDAASKGYTDGLTYLTAGTGLTRTGATLSINAAQAQITSLGTLTGLISSGNVSITASSDSTTTSSGALQVAGGAAVKTNLSVGANLRLFGATSGNVNIISPATTTTYTLTLPSAAPATTGSYIISDTSGNLSFLAPGTGSFTSLSVTNTLDGSVTSSIRNPSNTANAYAILSVLNNTGSGIALFINSSTRSGDGGINGATLRNDTGTMRLSAAYSSIANNITIENARTVVDKHIVMNAGSSSLLNFTTNGAWIGAPTTTTRSVGTRILLWGDDLGASLTDYAIGMESNALWYSVSSLAGSHKWYNGTTNTLSLSSGNLLLSNGTTTLNFTTGNKFGTATTGWITLDPGGSTNTGIAIYDGLEVSAVNPVVFTHAGAAVANGFPRVLSLLKPVLSVGSETITMLVGQSDSAYNTAHVGFNYVGAGSTSNYMQLGLHSMNNIMSLYGTGVVTIQTTTDSTSTITGSFQVKGGAAVAGNSSVGNQLWIGANAASWSALHTKGLFMRYATLTGQDSAYIQSIDRTTTTAYPLALEASTISFNSQATGNGVPQMTITPTVISILNTTDATTGSAGAFVVSGAVGIRKTLNVGYFGAGQDAVLRLTSNTNDGGINSIIFTHASVPGTYQKTSITTTALGTSQWARSDFSINVNTTGDTSNVTSADSKILISGSTGDVTVAKNFTVTGNVGIGTSGASIPTVSVNPAQLQIKGPATFDGAAHLFITNGSTDYGRTGIVLTGRFQAANDGWHISLGRNNIFFNMNSAAASGASVGAIGTTQFSIQHQMLANNLGILASGYSTTSPAFWIDNAGVVNTNSVLNVGVAATGIHTITTNSASGDVVRIQNTNAAGYSSVALRNSSGTVSAYLGIGNPSTTAPYVNNIYLTAAGTPNFILLNSIPSTIIQSTTDSSGTSSGALQVAGGVGIGNRLWTGGDIICGANIYGKTTGFFLYTVNTNKGLAISSAGDATSTGSYLVTANTNAGYMFNVVGGNGLAQSGGAGAFFSNVAGSGDLILRNISGNIRIGTGGASNLDILTSGNVVINTTADPSSATVGGALQIAGGLAVAKNVWIGNAIWLSDQLGASNGMLRFVSQGGTNYIQSGVTNATNSVAPLYFTAMQSGVPMMSLGTTGVLTVYATTDSTSTTTGALQVAGGVGIQKSLFVAGNGIQVDPTGTSAISISGVGTFGIDYPSVGNGRFYVDNAGNVGVTRGVFTASNSVTISSPSTGDGYNGKSLIIQSRLEPTKYSLYMNGAIIAGGIVGWYFGMMNNGTDYPNIVSFDRGYTTVNTGLTVNGVMRVNGTAADAVGHLVVDRSVAGSLGGTITIRNSGGANTVGTSAALAFGLDYSNPFAGTVSDANAEIRCYNEGPNSASALIFSTWNGTAVSERMRISSSGNLNLSGNLIVGGYMDIGFFRHGQTNVLATVLDGTSKPAVASNISLFNNISGDTHLRSYWGVSIDLNDGNLGNSTDAFNARIPNTSSFTVNARTSATAYKTLYSVRLNGDTYTAGNINATGEIISNSTGTGQFRAVSGNYGVFVRNDGNDFYLMSTPSGSPYGSWSTNRPLIYNMASNTNTSDSTWNFTNATDATTANTGAVKTSGGMYVAKNIMTGSGTMGPMLLVLWGYNDVAPGNNIQLSEPGSPGYNASLICTPGLIGTSEPGNWYRWRFIFRAVCLNTGFNGSNNQFQIQQQNYSYGVFNAGAQFGGGDVGQSRGYVTYASPWITGSDVAQFWLKVVSASSTVRIGPVYIQFSGSY